MHPVHSVASTGHTGDPQDLTTRPLQEISRDPKNTIQEHPRYSNGPRTLIVSWSDGPIVTHYSRALQRQIHLQIHMQIQRHIASLRRIIQEHYRDRYTCRYRAADADTDTDTDADTDTHADRDADADADADTEPESMRA